MRLPCLRLGYVWESTCEASRRAAGMPHGAELMPAHRNLVAILVDVRDVEIAVIVLHDRLPAKHFHVSKQFSEDSNALALDCHGIVETKTVFQAVGTLQMVVDISAQNPIVILLVIMEPELDLFCQVILGGSHGFQFRMDDFLRPVWVDRTDAAVNTDDGVQRSFVETRVDRPLLKCLKNISEFFWIALAVQNQFVGSRLQTPETRKLFISIFRAVTHGIFPSKNTHLVLAGVSRICWSSARESCFTGYYDKLLI